MHAASRLSLSLALWRVPRSKWMPLARRPPLARTRGPGSADEPERQPKSWRARGSASPRTCAIVALSVVYFILRITRVDQVCKIPSGVSGKVQLRRDMDSPGRTDGEAHRHASSHSVRSKIRRVVNFASSPGNRRHLLADRTCTGRHTCSSTGEHSNVNASLALPEALSSRSRRAGGSPDTLPTESRPIPTEPPIQPMIHYTT